MNRMLVAVLFGVVAICSPLWAQQDVATVLASLAEQTTEYQQSIPNFTCKEVVTTTARRGDKLLQHTEFQADVRVRRKVDKSLEETFSITNFMGKPTPEGGKFSLPLYMSGGLSEGMPSFFEQTSQSCYDYGATGGRVDFKAHDGNPKCHDVPGTVGFALLDSQSRLLHGEIQRPREAAGRKHVAAVARVDYGDVRLDERTFRMPTHVYGEATQGDVLRTFDAYYTSCKLFAAKTTIRPGDGAEGPPAP